ncbi:hypothetical protein [Chengkuizengella marina]|uniref:Uncharacterized protein n=1 Tax=Chengkuizengella marina TaxID=2507566 RepID=A0A6N9Q8S8_9BACL|nr:hypothetical protein [Chengkuizengella marina]NBI31262.1 hypothetical protein [Chengkuizengella marina]
MKRKYYFIFGSLFLIFSGLIYSIERLGTYIQWSAEAIAKSNMEMDIPQLSLANFYTNIFVIIFILISIINFVLYFKSKSSE